MEEVKEPKLTDPKDTESMESLSSEELDIDEPKRGQLREGVVLDATENGLVVDIGAKRDGFVQRSDLDNLTEEERERFATVDQETPVLVTDPKGNAGNVELSIYQALQEQDWKKAEDFKEAKKIHETEVLDSNRGGLIVNFEHLQGFVPMSQLIGFSRIRNPQKRYQRLQEMIGETILLKVIEVSQDRQRLIFSQRAASKEWRARRRDKLLEALEPNQIRSGRISQITDFGLFVNLGGIDGLVHVSELSWGRIENPEKVYKVGQRLRVKILNVDRERERIGLSLKALQPDPWESVVKNYEVEDLVEGAISQIVDFGIFVELEPGIEGLLHNSELISPSQREELESGEKILVKIIRIEPQRRRIGLSARQVQMHEWETWHAEHVSPAEEVPDEVEETEQEETSAPEEEVSAQAEPIVEVEDTVESETEESPTAEEEKDAEETPVSEEEFEAEAEPVVEVEDAVESETEESPTAEEEKDAVEAESEATEQEDVSEPEEEMVETEPEVDEAAVEETAVEETATSPTDEDMTSEESPEEEEEPKDTAAD